MQLLQIGERGIGGGGHVATVIDPPVLFQAEILAGSGHELPDAGGVARRVGLRVECTFHHRQQGDFRRHAALLHFFHDVIKVFLAAPHHAPDIFRAGGVPGLVGGGKRRLQVGHGVAVLDALPQVVVVFGGGIGLRRLDGGQRRGLGVGLRDRRAGRRADGGLCRLGRALAGGGLGWLAGKRTDQRRGGPAGRAGRWGGGLCRVGGTIRRIAGRCIAAAGIASAAIGAGGIAVRADG
ncbi:hypothetical protein GALL_315610 [mine drainage metagenome]|uniref:Uncharacterized protein n=1 Tax=mine drainage metagenome TaxID=410659 RepID=A0A1J5R3D5_9ZZZZ